MLKRCWFPSIGHISVQSEYTDKNWRVKLPTAGDGLLNMPGDSEGEVNILGDDSNCHCEEKNKVRLNMCLFQNVTETELFCISGYNSVRFLSVGLDEQQSLQKKDKVDTPDELLARIFDVAARITKREE